MQRTAVTGRKPSAKVTTLVNQGTRDSIVAQALIHWRTCGQIAHALGMERSVVEETLKQEMAKRQDMAYRRGYRDGRFSLIPPPAAATRKAA